MDGPIGGCPERRNVLGLPHIHRERATCGGVEARNFVPQEASGHPGDVGSQWCNRLPLVEDAQDGAEAPGVSDHHMMIEEGQQELAIGAFLLVHDGHAQDVEVQRGRWTVYCRCRRCEDVRTYEVDNEARERAIGLPPWPESGEQSG
jgi:hypothetical protein